MGEAAVTIADVLQDTFSNGFDSLAGCFKSVTSIADKTYVIDATDDDLAGVFIFDSNTNTRYRNRRTIPTILGTTPKLGKGHSSVLLNEDRILIVKSDATQDDCVWFLEIDTQFVRDKKEVLQTEVVAWSKGAIGIAQTPIVISGPSGVGKGTLISKLMEEFPSMFGFSVSHTTRAPREKEEDGIHYHFAQRDVMEKEIKDGKFLEFACVHDNLYGTSIEALEVVADAGKRCILDIDVQGAKSVKSSPLEAIFIFIKPPSFQELEGRLRARGTETEQQIQKRLRNARAEVEQGELSGIFDHILVNDDLEDCYKNLKNLLGLNDIATTYKSGPKFVDLSMPADQSVRVTSNYKSKILLSFGSQVVKNSSKNLFVLDVSSLKGGAPGRTRGLKLYAFDSASDNSNMTI